MRMKWAILVLVGLMSVLALTILQPALAKPANCDRAYPDQDVCIPSPPPDLDCKDISYRNFTVLPPDPHRFDGDKDGIGCETRR